MTETAPLERWCAELSEALGVDLEIATSPDVQLMLDLTRDAAHGISRPAAPLTAYIVGIAAALDGGTPEAVRKASEIAQRLALAHAADSETR